MKKFDERLINKIRNSQVIRIYDYEYYCSAKCLDGGCPYFYMDIVKIKDDEYEIYHGTSSEFDYCDVIGEFRDCGSCMYYDMDNDKCEIGYKTINWDELMAIVRDAIDNDYKAIVIYVNEEHYIDGYNGITIKEAKYPHYDCEICYDCGYEKYE